MKISAKIRKLKMVLFVCAYFCMIFLREKEFGVNGVATEVDWRENVAGKAVTTEIVQIFRFHLSFANN